MAAGPPVGYDHALMLVKAFTDPLLQGTATGAWDPESRQWARL
jgi:hypothetical protein